MLLSGLWVLVALLLVGGARSNGSGWVDSHWNIETRSEALQPVRKLHQGPQGKSGESWHLNKLPQGFTQTIQQQQDTLTVVKKSEETLLQGFGRCLRQEQQTPEGTRVVKTAVELLDAVLEGAENIEIQEHLNLTSLDLIDGNPFMFLLGIVPESVQSIRGNCAAEVPPSFTPPPEHAPLRALKPKQCVLLADSGLLFVEASKLWLDGIYVRLTSPRETSPQEDDAFTLFVWSRSRAEVWMTGVTLQGNGDGVQDCQTCGLGNTRDGKSYAKDCLFADFDGNRVVDAQNGGSVSLVDCNFTGNTILNATEPGIGAAVINTRAWDHSDGKTRLQGCSFWNNSFNLSTLPTLFADQRGTDLEALVFSDSEDPPVCTYEGRYPKEMWVEPKCEFDSPRPLKEAPDGVFLTGHDAWLVELQKLHGIDSGESKGVKVWIIAAGVAGGLVLLAAAAVVLCLVLRKRRQNSPPDGDKEAQEGDSRTSQYSTSMNSMHYANQKSHGQATSSDKDELLRNASVPNVLMHESMPVSTMASSLPHTSQVTVLQPPEEGASDEERKVFVQMQLESLKGSEVLGGLVFQEGLDSQAYGGQAVVQMATHRRNRQESAIKFFLSREVFNQEARQYTDGDNPLRRFLPDCRDIVDNLDLKLKDTLGRPLPPCIVMEKGESLDRWMRRNNRAMDQFTCMQIIHHICECLLDLHGAGFVHRDLKPANIMWLPSQNRWTLIDFGCAARIGQDAPTGFTLAYAAPEAVQARFRKGLHATTAKEALDAWSVGILAVELFTGRPSLVQFQDGRESVIAMLVGEVQLPWEGEGRAKALLKRAGRYKNAVLGLLHRDPLLRTTLPTFVQQYASILSTTTQQAGSSTTSRTQQISKRGGDDAQPKPSHLAVTEWATAHSIV